MKRIFSLLTIVLLAITAQAQSTSPRYVVYGTQDASSISFGQGVYSDVASATLDTIRLYPRHQQININLSIVDSCGLKLQSSAGSFLNDRMYVYVTNPAQSGILRLYGPWVVSTGTSVITLTANKHCVFEFWFDGVNWVEVSRNINY